ncbi:hypothetical protein BLNAU_13972 [Blattamonas nauphoetae]|uniref:Uncharacterized protein n=1 Tax=Blattamonas nauphoetae TaxID=2049346 RepID=A0ABQ9XJX4_9EUKA|nr:hypothetical protein BLNAU_13972 [Blattamonas nauphoetae]
MDSNNSIPKTDETLGGDVKNSVGLNRYGYIKFNTPSSISSRYCLSRLHEGDCVRMEVDLDSAPRTVQFFVNGETGRSYVSGIPSSVRIGFSLFGEGTSFRIDNISRLSQPTPISEGMNEVKCSITTNEQKHTEAESSSESGDEPVVTELRRLPPPKPKAGPSYGAKIQPKKKGIMSGVLRQFFDSADYELKKQKSETH